MPTYDYKCENCGNQFEQFQSIIAKPLRKCPDCGKRALVRLIGTGSGIIFKGSGFYETDYRNESYKKAVESEKKTSTKTSDKKDSTGKTKESKASDKPKAKDKKKTA